ncbi:hydantoinase/oxoprolinase family protein [Pseudonocardia benzenivorans]|jgi:N-methylhydantoinase A|uniref:5-oxoprolinase (ATP-hydrolyzing) n=2 Tax=Pseudonocardia TaxID=1847 RepID=F4CX31_PSEUX|nr:hydantoinase/oxoprolinase family protein [Pseudonocardia dioxanivorans]AEA24662.1 5-oxoprolinase (ATP-hydrolyzing) [Pseudonocardia dioxanivorans CB1190]
MYRIGIDVGGTFTDCVAVDEETGAVRTCKVPTTPQDQSDGFVAGVEALGVPMSEISLVLHGCTVGLNAVLTRTGNTIGVITTEGFRDVLAMGRGQRPGGDQFNPRWQREFGDTRRPFVPRHLRRTVAGRIDRDGVEVVPLDEAGLESEVRFLVGQGVEAIVVCLVNAYADDKHERQAARIVADVAPGLPCWTSTGVHPCFKEYPRFSTAAVNTYVGPLVQGYLERAERRLAELGYTGPLMLMQSNGGVLPAATARDRPAYTLQSGPSGGVIGSQRGGGRIGLQNLITLDIGGTSADCAVVADGRPVVTTELELEHDVIIALPALDVHSIGTGGGSIAWVDTRGALRVGPRSAGAEPGPACYGRGGTEPTVTDALAVLGILGQARFMGGTATFDTEAATAAVAPLGEALGLDTPAAAQAIVDVATAAMVEAAREVSVYNGIDPRRFALYAYGSAGPVFGASIGRALGCESVVVPPQPGEESAYGLALADLRMDVGEPVVKQLGELPPGALEDAYTRLRDDARRTLGDRPGIDVTRWLDGRYQGQTWETPGVPVPERPLDDAAMTELRANFDDTHRRTWGYAVGHADVKVTMARVTATVALGTPDAPELAASSGAAPPSAEGARIFRGGAWREVPVVDRAALRAGDRVDGPALVVQPTATTVLDDGDTARVEPTGHIVITWGADR